MREVVLNNTEMFMYGARPGWPRPLRARMADNACEYAKFGRSEKRSRFSRAAEFDEASKVSGGRRPRHAFCPVLL